MICNDRIFAQERVDAARATRTNSGRCDVTHMTDLDSFYDGLVEHGLIMPVARAGRVRPRRRVRGRARALQRARHAASRQGRRRRGLHVPAGDRSDDHREDATTSTRSRNLAGTVFSFFGKEQATRKALSAKVHAGEAVGRHAGHDRRRASPRRPATRSTRRSTGHAARGRPPRHDDELGLPARAVAGADAHAVVPRARVRARGHARRRSSRGATSGSSAASRCSRRSGCPRESDVASDPFFGRGGKMLAASQKEQKLKFEVLVPGDLAREARRRVCSFNYHQDHFGARLRHQARPTARSPTRRASASAWSAS